MTASLKTSELRLMQAMRASGAFNHEIRAATGRSYPTIARHLGPRPRTTPHPLDGMRNRAERNERLFRACNRAIAEARA